MIEFAKENDIREISEMWRDIFTEDEEVCSRFFEKIFKSAVTPILRKNGKIASALFLLPCSFGKFSGYSVYCAMTRPQYRGFGLMKELLDFSYNFVKRNGLRFLFLVPANESLFGYYKKCGFEKFGYKYIITSQKGGGDVKSCSDAEYLMQRAKNLKSADKIVYSNDIISYWLYACRHYGGEVILSDGAAALLFPDDEGITLRDMSGEKSGIMSIIKYAADKYPNKKITAEGVRNGKKLPCGMIKTDCEELLSGDCYIGITLE